MAAAAAASEAVASVAAAVAVKESYMYGMRVYGGANGGNKIRFVWNIRGKNIALTALPVYSYSIWAFSSYFLKLRQKH